MLKIIIITCCLFVVSGILSQEKRLFAKQDTVQSGYIPFEQIPTSSIEAIFQLDKVASELVANEQLMEEQDVVNQLLREVDSVLRIEKTLDIDSLVPRSLVNQRMYWRNYQSALTKRDSRLETIIRDLSLQRKAVNESMQRWQGTKQQMASLLNDSLITNSIDEVLTKVEEVKQLVLSKTNIVLPLLKKVKQYELTIEQLLQRLENVNKQQYDKLLVQSQPTIWEMDFKTLNSYQLQMYLKYFWQDNTSILKHFYNGNGQRTNFLLLYFVVMLVGFSLLKRKYLHVNNDRANMFKQATIHILQRPFSVALLITIFSSGLFLINRPPILIDISILILVIPLSDIIARLTDRRENRYLIIFFLLVLFRFVNYIFPPASLFNRLILLFMGSIEIVFLISLLRHFGARTIPNRAFAYFLRFVLIFHLLASATGVVAVLAGQLGLAEIAIDLSITNTLVGLLLIVTSVTLLGLIHLLIDFKRLRHLNVLQKNKTIIKKRINFVVIFLASLFWIDSVIKILRISHSFYDIISSFFQAKVSLGLISFTAGNVLLFFLIIWLSVVISGFIRVILEDDVLNNVSLAKGVPRMISVVIRFSLISAGVILAVSAVGMPLNQLTILFSAFSVGIGFGLQNIVNNFVSGVILLFERPIQIGDTVEIGPLMGTIKSMGIRSSKVRTFDGAEVIVPNANLISNELINWTLSDKRRRIEIISGVAYGSDVYKTQKLMLDAISQHPDVLKDPAPLVLFNDLGESSLDFRLLFWTDNFDNWIIIKSEMIFKIHDALYEAGITIPFPQRDLHIKTSDLSIVENDNKQSKS
ncbi:mechanosensitive ion channel domain-containing protein [Carboxylicivirga taeanensis]|uniref:mechanosensitive ion channel domain-containing protein n=1 Tax=Carboxylicivirga taeanensis TaxID=1416875 RepID=UPI003F6DF817